MCTVTFIKTNDAFFITSNRDEKAQRAPALPPEIYRVGEGLVLYPRDATAGGTWIALKDNLDAAVLLNGAFDAHAHQPPYGRSRGKVCTDIIAANGPLQFFSEMPLDRIEPFTLILLETHRLYECRWTGDKKYIKELSTNLNHIWSSATLYNWAVQRKREAWFTEWLMKEPAPSQQDILDFHLFAGDGDTHNDVRMNRDSRLFTVSITGIQIEAGSGLMHYMDLGNGKVYTKRMERPATYIG